VIPVRSHFPYSLSPTVLWNTQLLHIE
jgi:hypothetical protein